MKKKLAKRFLSLGLCGAMLMGCASGVSAEEQTGVSVTPQEYDFGGVELDIWMPLLFTSAVTDLNEAEVWKEVEKRLNVQLNFISPAKGTEKEAFNLMIASGDLPDIIYTGWNTSSGLFTEGGDAYIDNGILLRLNELVDEYMPNYKWALENIVINDEERKNFYTDNGNIFQILAISPYEEYIYQCISVRDDLFAEAGWEELPETIDEYEQAMLDLKEIGVDYPYYMPTDGIDSETRSGSFVAAYGIGPDFYQEDGAVKYGPVEDAFKEYLTKMNEWYEMGLIYPDFVAGDEEHRKGLWISGETAIMANSCDVAKSWLSNAESDGTATAGNPPVLNEGERVQWRQTNYQARFPNSAVITTACENPEAAAAFLDYGYCKERYMLYNYGFEGLTYELAENTLEFNGIEYSYGKFNDMIYGEGDATFYDQLMNYKVHIAPFLRFEHQSHPNLAKADNPNMATREWLTAAGDATLTLPNISLTASESEESQRIMDEVEAYQDTTVAQFIMGQKSLDEFDEYVETMKALGIETAIEYRQAALERYNAR